MLSRPTRINETSSKLFLFTRETDLVRTGWSIARGIEILLISLIHVGMIQMSWLTVIWSGTGYSNQCRGIYWHNVCDRNTNDEDQWQIRLDYHDFSCSDDEELFWINTISVNVLVEFRYCDLGQYLWSHPSRWWPADYIVWISEIETSLSSFRAGKVFWMMKYHSGEQSRRRLHSLDSIFFCRSGAQVRLIDVDEGGFHALSSVSREITFKLAYSISSKRKEQRIPLRNRTPTLAVSLSAVVSDDEFFIVYPIELSKTFFLLSLSLSLSVCVFLYFWSSLYHLVHFDAQIVWHIRLSSN